MKAIYIKFDPYCIRFLNGVHNNTPHPLALAMLRREVFWYEMVNLKLMMMVIEMRFFRVSFVHLICVLVMHFYHGSISFLPFGMRLKNNS